MFLNALPKMKELLLELLPPGYLFAKTRLVMSDVRVAEFRLLLCYPPVSSGFFYAGRFMMLLDVSLVALREEDIAADYCMTLLLRVLLMSGLYF